MTKTKNTKRALFASLMSLVICCAMLIGSTFAWFTDSVTTGKNKIVAGNLDVELYSKDANGEYVPVGADDSLFNDEALWEPGYTEVVYLKVANLGTLALKYKLAVTVDSETPGTNVNGETFKLSDYLVFGQAKIDSETTYATREEAQEAAGSTMGLNDYTNENVLYPAASGSTSEEYVALVVYMPTTVGNEANYRGTDIPTITLGVTLVATQTPYESDSFDNTYDKGIPLEFATDSGDVSTAVKNGEDVLLTEDVLSAGAMIAKGDVTVDLNGYTLSYNGRGMQVTTGNTVTIKNGTIESSSELPVLASGGTVNFENVTVESKTENMPAVWAQNSATVNVTGGTINSTSNDGIYISGTTDATDGCTLTVSGTEINAGRIGVWANNANNTVLIEDATINSNYWGVYQNGSYNGASITLKNSTINDTHENGAGVYISNSADRDLQELTIENCIISGSTAVEVKFTDLTVTNSTLSATYAEQKYAGSGNGACTLGYALAITSNSNGAPDTTKITLTNNTYNVAATGDSVIGGPAVYDVAAEAMVAYDASSND